LELARLLEAGCVSASLAARVARWQGRLSRDLVDTHARVAIALARHRS
jgi:hypothetical protein